MRKKTAAIAFILIICLLAGCKKNGNQPSIADYKKGSEGLVLEFLKGAPPDKIYEDSEFSAAVQIRNKGAYEVKNGVLLLNLESDYADTDNRKKAIDLPGRDIYNPNGGFETYQYLSKTRFIETQSEKHTSQVIATACYNMQAETTQDVCIDADYLSIRAGKKICEVKDIVLTDQGGPIAITKIEQRIIPKSSSDSLSAQFIIHIQNKGKGVPVSKYEIQSACGADPLVKQNFWNLVHLEQFRLSAEHYYDLKEESQYEAGTVTCKPNPVKLDKGTGQIICTTGEIKPESSYTAPLNIVLGYGYTESIAKSMIIERRA
jgi:hypothetical protein